MAKLSTAEVSRPNVHYAKLSSPTPGSTAPDAAPASARIPTVRDEVRAAFTEACRRAFPAAAPAQANVAVTKDAKTGDYQCSDAMAMFGKIKGKEGAPKSPKEAAARIAAELDPEGIAVEPQVTGPGFVTVRVNRARLAKRVQDVLLNGIGTWAPADLAGKRAVVDFSSPNVAKEMHVGHLRSTIIGDSLSRALEFCGADVLRLNHIGDWGTQFGMLIQYIGEKREGGLDASTDEDVADLQVLYRAAKARFDEDEEFKTRAREAVTTLQGGNPDYVRAWQRICEASRKEFQKIYERLDVRLVERGESFYNPRLKEIVRDLTDRGIAVESDGAMCVFIPKKDVPLMVRKSDGGYGYATTDMAAILQRLDEEKADIIFYVTDLGQFPHFDLVFRSAEKAGYLPEDRPVRIEHVGFGFVAGDDGKKFKSRSGDTVRLVELLDEARDRCIATITSRRPDISEEELAHAAAAMGYGAVKYADLKNNRTTNYRFSYDDMLALNGDTAVYLLYAHARIASIIRKSGKDPNELAKTATLVITEPQEAVLASQLAKFPDALREMINMAAPSRICAYLYDLSGVFNQFYTNCQVIGSEQEDSRLLLCEATAVVMRKCFNLLGITPLYRI